MSYTIFIIGNVVLIAVLYYVVKDNINKLIIKNFYTLIKGVP